jgi:hypothetical protein
MNTNTGRPREKRMEKWEDEYKTKDEALGSCGGLQD